MRCFDRVRLYTSHRYALTVLMLAIGLATVALPTRSVATPPAAPNPDFTLGEKDSPQDWTLANGKGTWKDGVLQVTGNGEDNAKWQSAPVSFQPGQLYQLITRVRKIGSKGSVIAGPSFANYDHSYVDSEWCEKTQTFRVPEGTTKAPLRLGHWKADGQVEFDKIELTRVTPIHLETEGVCLGRGENVMDGTYTFDGYFGGSQGTCHRTFVSTNASFNSNRWCMVDGQTVTYRFDSPEGNFTEAQADVSVSYYKRGTCTIEASHDGKTWKKLGQLEEVKPETFPLPAEMLPAKTIFIRVQATGKNAYFQVGKIAFSAKYEQNQTPKEINGKTILAKIRGDQDISEIEPVTYSIDYRKGMAFFRPATIPTMKSTPYCVELSEKPTNLTLQIEDHTEKKDYRYLLDMVITLPEFYRSDYGERFALGSNATGGENTAVWWCRADHKVPRVRRVPEKQATAVKLSAAKNDRESVQVIVAPKEELKGLQAKVSDLTGPAGATLSAKNVKILRAYYHRVHRPTDGTGLADWWPDALPPLDTPLDVAAGMNQPIWLVVHVPEEAKAGTYTGQLHLTAEKFDATVPVQLTVWNYTLPKKNHIATAFGLKTHNIFRYHNAKTDTDKRKLLDLYFQSFAEHRISPYDPTPMDPIRATFDPKSDPPSAKVDFSRFDPAMEKAVKNYNFTNFRLWFKGMGSGTFHERYAGRIAGFTEETPEYKAMFSSYVQQIQNHLKEKGWLDMAYIYWFDEPAPKDYEFVSNGMTKLKRYAPELKTMLTVHMEPNDELRDIDIWCPVSNRYDTSMPGLAKDHEVWWYVCTGPKAPYCTLFIDHAATELRVWHWQAWKRNIVGSLVWSSNYWTSSAAFPDKAQNPYEDPMGYKQGYSLPKGTKAYWGNGDGRFLYPPLAAAEPGLADGKPVIAPPVSSIRWEMLREGIEDWESLYLLRELIATKRDSLSPKMIQKAEALLTVPESITVDMTHFTTDPEPIYTHREKVAKMIEKLSK